MITKNEVLKKIKRYGICKGIYCGDCPFDEKNGCSIGITLRKLGAEVMLENKSFTRQTNNRASVKGYVIKEKDKNRYYRGSVKGYGFSGFYDAKIYRSYKRALKALQSIKSQGNDFEYSIYEVEVAVNSEIREIEKD